MRRLIVTGANGSGKSHLAARLSHARPDAALLSFDAMKLTRDWKRRPRAEVEETLATAIRRDCWVLEGGPSLLPLALPRADAVIWLDPPLRLRAWRLVRRPWANLGRTRPELPPGNSDWPLRQYRFAWRSLRADAALRRAIASALAGTSIPTFHCCDAIGAEAAIEVWHAG